MTFNPRRWEPVAWILTVINVGAVWFVGPGEPWHAGAHAVLAVVFGLWAQNLRRRRMDLVPDESMVERLRELEARVAELDTLHNVEARLAELEERLDFAERALVDVRARAQIPPRP